MKAISLHMRKLTAKNIVQFLSAIVMCELAGIIGSIFTASAIPVWYVTLVKSTVNPPAWVFGPVWTLLYFLMGISLFLIWKNKSGSLERRKGLILFSTQLALNTLWSIVFFGLHNPGLALINIVALWVMILATMISFYKISRPAMYLLVPYILWVSFASYLNYAIWVLN